MGHDPLDCHLDLREQDTRNKAEEEEERRRGGEEEKSIREIRLNPCRPPHPQSSQITASSGRREGLHEYVIP